MTSPESAESSPKPHSARPIQHWRAARSTERLQRVFSDPDFDDSDWHLIDVPSHWQSNPSFSDFDGTLLYRADVTVPSLQPGQRRWLRFDGLCYKGDVFLDGAYVGQTEGYFTHHRFEITDLAERRGKSVLAVEVSAPHGSDTNPKRDLTGWFSEGPGLPCTWNPAGIWRPVHIVDTGPVVIRHFRAQCSEADANHATVNLRAVLLAAGPGEVTLVTEVAGVEQQTVHSLAAGENRIEWQVEVPDPELWWPIGLGDQPLFDLSVVARTADGSISDRKQRRIGFRTTSMRDFILRINNKRTFAKGINIGPLATDMATMSADEVRREADEIARCGFNLVRVRAHVTRHEFLDRCDELGLMVWQDLPLVGSYVRGITDRVEQQLRDMVDLFSHHPSIVLWGGHLRPHTNEPRDAAAPDLRRQQIPSWNRTILDRSIRRAFERDDPTRPTVTHSDVAPHLPHLSGSDLGLYFGWLSGEAADIVEYAATIPRLVRWVSDMGAQALPVASTANLDQLTSVHGADGAAVRRVHPPTKYEDLPSYTEATRQHQADVLKVTIETLRVLKYEPTGGFCAGLWKGAGPGLGRGLNDADGTPRPALDAARIALQPLLGVLYPATPVLSARATSLLALHLCNDGIEDRDVEIVATISDQRGTHTRRWSGIAPADDVQFIDDLTIRGGRLGSEMRVELSVIDNATGVSLSTNEYVFVAD